MEGKDMFRFGTHFICKIGIKAPNVREMKLSVDPGLGWWELEILLEVLISELAEN